MGVFGDWDNPYLTMNFKQGGHCSFVFAIAKAGHIEPGLKTCELVFGLWFCFAEAEVEYEDKNLMRLTLALRLST